MNDPSGKGDGIAQRRGSGFLSALGRNTAGNTLAMMAAFLLPLTMLVGSAVDMSRLYLVKVRLQQACDAGVLAGRKLMTVTSGTTIDATAGGPAETAAMAFFQNNFPSGWMSTTGRSFTVSRTADSQVTGTASVTVPMAVMGAFGAAPQTQTVTCNARLDIGDTDIMFVLDVTGSMACDTGTACTSTNTWIRGDGTTGYYQVEESNSKIDALRSAVKLFRTTLETGKPAAAHIRYGFVPYSSSVNTGALIYAKNPNYLVDTATYPSRELAGASYYGADAASASTTVPASYRVTVDDVNKGDVNYLNSGDTAPTGTTVSGATSANCVSNNETRRFSNTGSTEQPAGTWPTSSAVIVTHTLPVWSSGSCKTYAWKVKPLWRYASVSLDVSTYKTGASTTDPTKLYGATTQWPGCIEERDSVQSTTTTTFDISDLPGDLDPDVVPISDATRWRPQWPSAVYYRAGTADSFDAGPTGSSSDTNTTTAVGNFTPLLMTNTLGTNFQFYACSAPAHTLAVRDAAWFDTYLGPDDPTAMSGDFRAMGRTYHDVGMLWGLRLISPDGPWSSTTEAWPGNNPPNRYIVFMSDGVMQTEDHSYGLYSLNYLMGRAASTGTSDTNLDTIHNLRFQALCDAAQAKNITVFVVAFDVGATVPTNLNSCATPGFAYAAQSKTQLQDAFRKIALEIARLRLSQ